MADILKDEITNDPLVRGYSGMSNIEIANDLNTTYRSQNKTILSSSEIANAMDVTEFTALAAGDRDEIWNWLSLGQLNPFGIEATRFTTIFSGGSATIAALGAIRIQAITRAQELKLGTVREGHVEGAKA